MIFFTPDFKSFSCKLDNFAFEVLYRVILFWYCIKVKSDYNNLTFSCKKSKNSFFSFFHNKKHCCVLSRSVLPVILICCIHLHQHQVHMFYLILLLSSYEVIHKHYCSNVFSIIYLCIVYFTYGISKWKLIFKYYFLIDIGYTRNHILYVWECYCFFKNNVWISMIK